MANTTTLVKPLFEHARKVPFNIAPAQGARERHLPVQGSVRS